MNWFFRVCENEVEEIIFNFDKNDENKSFDDDKLSTNINNFFDDMNENENEIDSAKNSQKKNAMTKIVDEKSINSDLKNDWKKFFNF